MITFARFKCVLSLVSTERNKDFPDVEVTESVAEEVVVAYVIYQLLPLGVNEDVTKT